MEPVVDITICPICRQIFSDPKMLPCLHNFCLKCLETFNVDQQGVEVHSPGVRRTNGQITNAASTDRHSSVDRERSPDSQSTDAESTDDGQDTDTPSTSGQSTTESSNCGRAYCKICLTAYAIPAGGLSRLPSSAFVKQLAVFANLSLTANPKSCEICPPTRESVSSVFCIDCEQVMCDECKETHWRARFSKNHKPLVFGSKLDPAVMKERNCLCERHPQSQLKMYCRDHKTTICYECAAVDHRNDHCAELSKVIEPVEGQLNDGLKKMEVRLAECKAAIDKLNEIGNGLKQEVKYTEEAIEKSVSECITFIRKAGETQRERLSIWKDTNLDAIEVKKGEVEKFVNRIEVYKRHAGELLKQGSPADFADAMDLMNAKTQELDASPKDCGGTDLNIERTAFCPTNLESLLLASGMRSAVGELHFIPASQRCIKFSRSSQDQTSAIQPIPIATDQGQNGSQIPTVEVDGIRSLEDASAIAELLETSTYSGERIEWRNFHEANRALQIRFHDEIKYQFKCLTLEGQNLVFNYRKDEFKPYQAQLLMLNDFPAELRNSGVQCNLRITREGVFLRGSEESKDTAKLAIYDKIMKIVRISPSAVSEVQSKLMMRDSVQEYVLDSCQQQSIKATLASDPSLQLCAFDEEENAKLENLLPSLIKELEFPLDVSTTAAAALEDELKKRQEEIEFIIDPVLKKIRISCLDKDEAEIRKFLEQFIRDNIIVEKRVSIRKNLNDYIRHHNLEALYLLKETLQKEGGSLLYNESAITIRGNSSMVDAADAQLQGIAGRLVEKSYTVDHPAGENFFTKTAQGPLILKGIESEAKARITVKSMEQGPLSTDREAIPTPEFESSIEVRSSSACSILMRLVSNGGATVTVVDGKIESQRVDVIVNSTDKNLHLNSGEVSIAILTAAGPSILEECKKRKVPLEAGKIFGTTGCNLPCKVVYHGFAMPWDDGKGKSKTILADLIRNCLQQADIEKQKSVAFPAIGAGTLNFPKDIVIKTFFEVVEAFKRSHPATTLTDIRFVIFNKNQTEELMARLESLTSRGGSWRKFERLPLQPNPIQTSLTILASSEKSADDVCKKVEDILKMHTAVDCIDSAPEAEDIGFLTDEQIRRIQALQSSYSVRIWLETTVSSTQILLIKGTPRDVVTVGGIVRNLIRNGN